MDNQKQQVVERLKQANNILVTVKSNPSVDQLAACIGLTVALNKMGKHATAVFSGAVPSTIEFLQPEKTLEKNTDSLQDFIIALDKSKADKLRYKVEDTMVKIFITPYRTSISQDDLQFSQGDFNVDVVLALGVHAQTDLDQAITAHGRILHDATVMTMNVSPGNNLGSINWLDAGVSSLSELCMQLVDGIDQKLVDGQIATAFLTGIVAETERFSNQKTSPQTMSISAELMAAGANQQLVASKLEEPAPAPQRPIAETAPNPERQGAPQKEPVAPPKPDDGTIEINHDGETPPEAPLEAPSPEPEKPKAPEIHINEQGELQPFKQESNEDKLPPEPPLPPIIKEAGPRLMTEPPTFDSSPITANVEPEKEDSAVNPLSLPEVGLLNREPLSSQANPGNPATPSAQTPSGGPLPPPASPRLATPPSFTPPPMATSPTAPSSAPAGGESKTLSQIEESVHSPHIVSPTVSPVSPTPASAPAAPSPELPTPPSAAPSSVIAPSAAQPSEGASSPSSSVNDARDLVAQAIGSSPNQQLEPIVALNAAPLGNELHPAQSPASPAEPTLPSPGVPVTPPELQTTPPSPQDPAQPSSQGGSTPPPAVPPPMMPLPPTLPPQ